MTQHPEDAEYELENPEDSIRSGYNSKYKLPVAVFKVGLTRTSTAEPWGLEMSHGGTSALYVYRAGTDLNTAVGRYNKAASEETRLREGDYVTEANGPLKSPEDALAALADMNVNTSLDLNVERPNVFDVQVVLKSGQQHGIEAEGDQSGTLVVTTIGKGAVKTNRLDIQQGDRILRVGDKRSSSAQELQQKMDAAKNTLILQISRPSSWL